MSSIDVSPLVNRRGGSTDPATLRVAVTDEPTAADVTLPLSPTSCWAGFLGHYALPHDTALDTLAAVMETRDPPPDRVELVGAPAACLLPALWLRTIWLGADATIELEWPEVVPPGADFGETLAARLCCGLVDRVVCPDEAAAWAHWGISVGPQEPLGVDAFDIGLALADAWDLRVQWALGAGRTEWLFRAKRALDECAERGLEPVALYGAGTHTRALGPVLLAPPVEVACIIDDHLAQTKARLWGFPVVSKDEAVTMGVKAVILSANTWEDRLWEASASLRDAGIEVLRLYGASDPKEVS